MTPILQFDRISKRFPGVAALSDVSFEIAAGECHAIVGENGAGKSTLGKIVAGIHRPDGGRLLLNGRETTFHSPLAAAAAGVSIVHQELAFCPNLSVAENLFLGCTPSAGGFVRWREMDRQARRMLANVGLAIDPWTPMDRLSTAQEQLVQIAVAVGRGARIIIMDEPTSSLSQVEAERLFEIIAQLHRDGVTLLYVSHRLEEIMRLCDRITVLRDGRYVQTVKTAETSTEEIVRLMIGRPLADYFPAHVRGRRGPALLSVEKLTAPGRFENISFDLHAGEIVGLAGLVGAGRSEIARAIFGIDPFTHGTIRLHGRLVTIRSAREAIALGLGLLPEDRKRQALVLSMTCKENLSLSLLSRLKRGLFIDHARERSLAGDYFRQLRVRAPSIDAPIAGLSGGNQQKIALAKWLALDTAAGAKLGDRCTIRAAERHPPSQGLAQRCKVLILDEPTRGVDVGAKAEIHALIDRLATEGYGILLISSELPEILNLSTRIIVLACGRIAGELPRQQATQENLMRLMANVQAA